MESLARVNTSRMPEALDKDKRPLHFIRTPLNIRTVPELQVPSAGKLHQPTYRLSACLDITGKRISDFERAGHAKRHGNGHTGLGDYANLIARHHAVR